MRQHRPRAAGASRGCVHARISWRDIERAVSERTAALERRNHELDAFVREVAHEIRTPIGQVAGIAEILLERLKSAGGADLRPWLELQIRTAAVMSAMVKDLLELARETHGTNPLDDVDLSRMCVQLRDELGVLDDERPPIDWRIQPGMRVQGAEAQVRLLMRNLLSNAIKYTRDAPRPSIVVSMRDDEAGRRCIVVEDNGAGFDDEGAHRLFHPFVRLHDARQFQGVGLGLSLSKRIVERHGGEIRARGWPGKGARFEFTLSAAVTV